MCPADAHLLQIITLFSRESVHKETPAVPLNCWYFSHSVSQRIHFSKIITAKLFNLLKSFFKNIKRQEILIKDVFLPF